MLLAMGSCTQNGEKEGDKSDGKLKLDSSRVESEGDRVKSESEEWNVEDTDSAIRASREPSQDLDGWPKPGYFADQNFHPPLDGNLELSGSFGELRGNHFHAGLDLRTGGQEGANVYAIANGVVSRIKVSPRGYGKVLYISHPNGTMSVYGHLKKFNPTIQAYVEKAQYKKRSYAIELFPGNALKVNRGEVIAISGNTGGSAGPHLHFEVRNSRTENTINPILYGIKVQDKITPTIYNLMVYEIDAEKRKNTGAFPYKKVSPKSKVLKLKPGNYGFAVQVLDHQLDRLNKLGVNYMRLVANDKVLHETSIEKLRFDQGRYIQTHYDYYTKSKTGGTYTKLFLDKKNPLPLYKHRDKGIIELKQGDSIDVEVAVSDMALHIKRVKLKVIGDTTAKDLNNAPSSGNSFTARSWRNSNYSDDNVRLNVPSRAMYFDARIGVSEKAQKKGAFSKTIRVHHDRIPLHTYYTISIKADNIPTGLEDKLLIVNGSYGRPISEGGSYNSGWVSTKTRSFGDYYVGIDTIAPKAKVTISNRNIFVRASDNLAGIDKYICSIDDQWILLEYHPNMGKMIGEIPDWVKPGKHLFELKVWDSKGNKTHKKFNITVQ